MPKAYVITTEAIKGPAGMAEYPTAAAPAITEGPGTLPALDPAPEVLEGNWHGKQTARQSAMRMMSFPKFSPLNIPANARGVFSNPSTMSSR